MDLQRCVVFQMNRAQKLIEHKDEGDSGPKRNWFQTHKERELEKGWSVFVIILKYVMSFLCAAKFTWAFVSLDQLLFVLGTSPN